ncbi:MAG: hypothetical protein JWM97_844 [Phycisphaerales bacterium]|nr:hypothetical protein [Phycisphaerales bacterium]
MKSMKVRQIATFRGIWKRTFCGRNAHLKPAKTDAAKAEKPARNSFLVVLFCGLCLCADAAPAPPLYSNDFENAPVGKVPDDLMILNGTFAVAQEAGNKFLELAPDPMDGDGLLFGPADVTACEVAARIRSSASGRRFPEFGIGSNDAGGYKLIVVPAQGIIELHRADETKASATFAWKSGAWTHLRLRVSKDESGKWKVQGKAWTEGSPEPGEWAVNFDDTEAPPAGRASAWGTPYAGKPIRFDDLSVRRF